MHPRFAITWLNAANNAIADITGLGFCAYATQIDLSGDASDVNSLQSLKHLDLLFLGGNRAISERQLSLFDAKHIRDYR